MMSNTRRQDDIIISCSMIICKFLTAATPIFSIWFVISERIKYSPTQVFFDVPLVLGIRVLALLVFLSPSHNLEHNSIACVREECIRNNGTNCGSSSSSSSSTTKTTFRTLTGCETLEQHGLHLIRVPTVQAILQKRWFLEQIRTARTKFSKSLTSGLHNVTIGGTTTT
jgi:hypothetical protein